MPDPLPEPRRLPLWAIGLLVAALTYVQMVRRPSDPPVWDSLFAEDGKIFLSQAINGHFLNTLATSYFGYLHTAPRFITIVATWFGLDDAPLVMSLLTTLFVSLACVYVFHASAAWIASPLLRAVLALAVAFVPVTARELSGTVANLHWYYVYAAFWAAICPWRSRGWLTVSTLVVGVAVLSDPLTGIALPLALAFAIRSGERRALLIPATIAAGLLIQLGLRDEGTTFFGNSSDAPIVRIFAERVTSSLLVGDRYLRDVFGAKTGSPFAWASLVLVAAAVAAGLWRLRGRRAWLLGGGAVLCVGFFLIAVLGRGTRSFYPHSPWKLGSTRYIYLPVMFLLTGLLAALDRREAGGRRLPWRELAVAAFVLATMAVGLRAPHRSEGQPAWKPTLAQARTACATRRPAGIVTLYVDRERRLTAVVPIDPPNIWNVPVRCSRLGGGRPPPAAARSLTIAWVGDMSLSSELGLPPARGPGPLAGVARELRASDLTLGNLEGTLGSGGHSKCRPGAKDCVTFRAPARYASTYARAGFDTLNLANNHSFDFGAKGLRATIAALDGAGVGHAGLAGEIAVRRVRGTPVALVGFAPYSWSGSLRDLAAARALVRRASARAPVVVAMMHAGAEGAGQTRTPTGVERAFGENRGDTRAFAHAAVDSGADLVVGSGPHVLRGIEVYRGRPIAYSLGNFLAYDTLFHGGVFALSGILSVRVDGAGRPRAARLTSVRLVDPGVPRVDPTGAAGRLVSQVSRADFGARGARVDRRSRVMLGD